ncbi:MAG: DUF481 domain-containing protein [Myxococcota bacterium]|nr:DUF481 domain-containing protein [Myxococcota bacterium]
MSPCKQFVLLPVILTVLLFENTESHASEKANEKQSKYSLRVSSGGSFFSGNLNQVQLNGRLHHAYNSDTLGYDFIAMGFRFWLKPRGTEEYRRVGDDLSLIAIPFWYFDKSFFLMPVIRYESSQLYAIDHRMNAGLNVGYTPVRSRNFLARISIGGAFEHSTFSSDEFMPTPEVSNDGRTLSGFRVAVQSNGWFRVKESPLSFRYLFNGFVDPTNPGDFRAILDASANVRLFGPLGLRLSTLLNYRSVGLVGVEPFDVRTTAGLSFTLK